MVFVFLTGASFMNANTIKENVSSPDCTADAMEFGGLWDNGDEYWEWYWTDRYFEFYCNDDGTYKKEQPQ